MVVRVAGPRGGGLLVVVVVVDGGVGVGVEVRGRTSWVEDDIVGVVYVGVSRFFFYFFLNYED
jgi:hypothetical protein